MAGKASSLPYAFHADLLELDQPSRAVLRIYHRRPAPTVRPSISAGPRGRHPGLDRSVERESQAVHLDQDRRPDPREARTTSTTNYRRMTLDGTTSLDTLNEDRGRDPGDGGCSPCRSFASWRRSTRTGAETP